MAVDASSVDASCEHGTVESSQKQALNGPCCFCRRRKRTLLLAAAFLAVIAIASFATDVQLTATGSLTIQVETRQSDERVNHRSSWRSTEKGTGSPEKQCVIHIHGLHHSGTGFTRQAVYNSLGGNTTASMHTHTNKPEDEGQHIQHVFPRLGLRQSTRCGASKPEQVGHCYYCPTLSAPIDTGTTNRSSTRAIRKRQGLQKKRLHAEWTRYWDMSKPFLIQKTPTLDVLLLEQLKVLPTVHVIVMRHPLAWNSPMQGRKHPPFLHTPSFQPMVWFDGWAHVLGLLRGQRSSSSSSNDAVIESFAVVQYETLLLHHAAVSKELSNLIQGECQINLTTMIAPTTAPGDEIDGDFEQYIINDGGQGQRQLHLYDNLDLSQYLAPYASTINLYRSCLRKSKSCRKFLEDTASLLQSEFGYQWDPQQRFELPVLTRTSSSNDNISSSNDDEDDDADSLLLFTNRKPPSAQLVQKMKEIVETMGSYVKS